MSNFCSLTGFCTTLEEDLSSGDVMLCINSTKIGKALTADKHSYLVISDGIECEHVKIRIDNGKVIAIDRGVGWTDAIDWPKGTPIKFDWTDEAWADAYDCLLEEENEDNPEDCDIKIGDCTYKYVDTVDGVKCYEADNKKDLEIKNCGKVYTIKNIEYTEANDPDYPEDGVYTNATVTVSGCKVSYKEGCKVSIGGCSPGCNCDKCTNTEEDEV